MCGQAEGQRANATTAAASTEHMKALLDTLRNNYDVFQDKVEAARSTIPKNDENVLDISRMKNELVSTLANLTIYAAW